jgi:hypothetical protein
MRCGQCGARNPASATWCSQCFASLGDRTPAPPPTPVEAPRPAEPPSPGSVPPAADPAGASGDPDRSVRERDGEVEWRCGTCDGWSPLVAPRCVGCGAPRTGFGADEAPTPAPGDADQLVAWTLLLPGLGHLRAGRAGSGVARAVIAVGWLTGGVLLGATALRAGAAPLAALPLLAGALVVWAASVRDVRALARGQHRELLDARGLLWLVAGVTGLLVVTLLLQTTRLAG